MRFKYMHFIYCIFWVLGLIFLACMASAQKVFLVHKKNKVPFPNINYHFDVLGLTTNTDTIRYNEDLVEGFRIVEVGKDSVKLRRPLKYSEFSIRKGYKYNRPGAPDVRPLDSNYHLRKEYKRGGIRYYLFTRVDQYEYRRFAYKDIRTLVYPTYHGSGDGCAGCILVPGINVIFLVYAIRRWRPHRLDMTKWKFVVE